MKITLISKKTTKTPNNNNNNKWNFSFFNLLLSFMWSCLEKSFKRKNNNNKKDWELTGLRVLCSLKLSSRMADWSLESLSFFLEVSPSSSSLIPREHALSISCSSLSLRFKLTLDTVLLGDDAPASSSHSSTADGNRFTSIPRRNDRASPLHVSDEFRSAC